MNEQEQRLTGMYNVQPSLLEELVFPDGTFGNDPNGYPDHNPKTAQGALKIPLDLVPPSSSHFLALAFKNGADKYGPYNWRERGISSSVYYAAAKRHLDSWWDGEDVAEDSGVHHIAHAMACMALILDSMTVGTLNDNRPPKGASAILQKEYTLA